METPKKRIISWLKYTRRLDVPKKHFKVAFRQYGMSLNQALQACDYYSEMMKYRADKIVIDYSSIDQMGKKRIEPVCWPLTCFVIIYNCAIQGHTWLDALVKIEDEHLYIMSESRINDYAHDMRENAMSRYYKGATAMIRGDYDGESDLLAPNEALELARLFATFMLRNISVKNFIEDAITFRDPFFIEEFTKEEELAYRQIVKWLMETLWPKAFSIKEKVAKDLITIVSYNDENRRKAVFMLVYYLIGFVDLSNNIIHAAGECPFDEEGQEWINKMLSKEII